MGSRKPPHLLSLTSKILASHTGIPIGLERIRRRMGGCSFINSW